MHHVVEGVVRRHRPDPRLVPDAERLTGIFPKRWELRNPRQSKGRVVVTLLNGDVIGLGSEL